jgi:hypothetical protein
MKKSRITTVTAALAFTFIVASTSSFATNSTQKPPQAQKGASFYSLVVAYFKN